MELTRKQQKKVDALEFPVDRAFYSVLRDISDELLGDAAEHARHGVAGEATDRTVASLQDAADLTLKLRQSYQTLDVLQKAAEVAAEQDDFAVWYRLVKVYGPQLVSSGIKAAFPATGVFKTIAFDLGAGFIIDWSAEALTAEAFRQLEDSYPTKITAYRYKLKGGYDTFFGTEKNEFVKGSRHDDRIFLIDGRNEAYGKGGDDLIVGGVKKDIILGGRGNDTIIEGMNLSKDRIHGGPGDDYINPGRGGDTIHGDQGDDVFVYNRGSIGSEFYGGGGTDTLITRVWHTNLNLLSVKSIERVILAEDTPFENGQLVNGTRKAEELVGNSSGNRLVGGGGKDVISAGDGDDHIKVTDHRFVSIDGGAGFDTLDLRGVKLKKVDLTRVNGIERILTDDLPLTTFKQDPDAGDGTQPPITWTSRATGDDGTRPVWVVHGNHVVGADARLTNDGRRVPTAGDRDKAPFKVDIERFPEPLLLIGDRSRIELAEGASIKIRIAIDTPTGTADSPLGYVDREAFWDSGSKFHQRIVTKRPYGSEPDGFVQFLSRFTSDVSNMQFRNVVETLTPTAPDLPDDPDLQDVPLAEILKAAFETGIGSLSWETTTDRTSRNNIGFHFDVDAEIDYFRYSEDRIVFEFV